MKAAFVSTPGAAPIYGEFATPVLGDREVIVTVTAAALSQVTRSRAAGTHYTSSGESAFVPGVDGVGRLADGRRVYFALPRAPFGAMAEESVVSRGLCVPLPDGLDDITAAAIANPGGSSWAALTERAQLQPGETVLVNGATGIAGRLAVQIARHLGAGKVIATARNEADLATVGADSTISLSGDPAVRERELAETFAAGVDVVLDYLWGKSAEELLIAAARHGADALPIRYVEIGAVSGQDIVLPSPVLRASAIVLMGSGIGSVAPDRFLAATSALLEAVVPARLAIATRPMPLANIAAAWAETDRSRRIVLTTGN